MNETPQATEPRQPLKPQLDITKVYELLNCLGITANYNGFLFTAYAVKLAVEEPEQLAVITKRLYPAVARRYQTNAIAVERNIRTVISLAWERNPQLLEELARHPLQRKPTSSQFLSIMAMHFSPKGEPALRQSA